MPPEATGTSAMDRVQELAAAIAGLKPKEKQRLFRLLAERGDLPDVATLSAQRTAQLDFLPPSSTSSQPLDYLVVFDGGSKGNPGWGYGSYAITRVQDGAQRLERLDFGDEYTNNEAEYDSLIAALQDLLKRIERARREPQEFSVEIRGDSTLVINQVLGKWKARDARMRERRDRCRRLLSRFGAAELKLQPRKESVRVLGH